MSTNCSYINIGNLWLAKLIPMEVINLPKVVDSSSDFTHHHFLNS